jgi:hypothetical protein
MRPRLTARTARTSALTAALATACALLAGVARAEPAPDERTLARSLFEEGRGLAKNGRFTEACPKLEESQRLDPGIGTLFNLADCLEHEGRTASAWSAFSETADLAHRRDQQEREVLARERAAALLPQLAKIRLHLDGIMPAGLTLTFDKKALSAAVIDTDLPVDPGVHEIVASAHGKAPAKATVTARAGAVEQLTLPPLADLPAEGPATAAEAPVAKPTEPERARPWQRPASYVAGGLAAVGLGVGAFFGLKANSQWSDAKASCTGSRCDTAGYAGWSDARSSATTSTVSFAVGGVLAAAAIVLFVTAPSDEGRGPRAAARPLGGTF